MYKYFVLFSADHNSGGCQNDVIDVESKVDSIETLRELEESIERKWFDDGRGVTLLNFKRLD